MMKSYYSNGKLLLSGEYFVLDGARSLAIPTRFGQKMTVKEISSRQLVWQSFNEEKNCWLEAIFDLPKLRLSKANYEAATDGGIDGIAETLFDILIKVKAINPSIFNVKEGLQIETFLNFPRDWGLGSSSTLINNIASWASIDPYVLLDRTFKGSGYDIAAAQSEKPLIYTRSKNGPIVEAVPFNPKFKDQLFFVHLNKKQSSREGIQRYQSLKGKVTSQIKEISEVTDGMVRATSLEDFEKLLAEHERIVAATIKLPPIQEALFSDYFGQIKSLGAWGGDFILATGDQRTKAYFSEKGFETVVPYKKMILK